MKVKILDMNGNIKNIKRFPRPLGTTSLAIEYSLTPSDENRFRLYNHVIHQWLLSNGKFGGKYMDVNTLSQITGIPTDYIQCFMRDQVMNSKIWDKDKQEELINGLLGQTLAWALEDRLAIKSQVDLLRQSQNGHYTPFVSAELNKAMKMMLDSSTGLQSVIRTFMGGGTTNIFNMFNQQNNVDNHQENGISLEEAKQLILESNVVLNDKSKEARFLETKYDLMALPEVVATKQEGIDNEDYGGSFNINQTELKEVTDDYKASIEASSKDRHEMRREIEQNIDPDEEDPESYIELNDDQYKEPDDQSFASKFLNP
jgi:hypothetical protein